MSAVVRPLRWHRCLRAAGAKAALARGTARPAVGRVRPPRECRRCPDAVAGRVDVLPALPFSCAATILPGKVVAQHVEVERPRAAGRQPVGGAPSMDAVRKTSVARVSRIIFLWASAAMPPVAMKRVPM